MTSRALKSAGRVKETLAVTARASLAFDANDVAVQQRIVGTDDTAA
jgi:hypothetical protein